MSVELWTLAIAVVTSTACGLCGTLLLVNRQAMVSEGLSHAVLPGLVLAFLVFRSFDSPWLIVSAAASGILMIWLTQALKNTGLVDPDAGLGIVFAGMFSLGILLVSLNLRNTHFHAGCIIDGNLALASLDRWEFRGIDLGPKSWVAMLAMLALSGGFVMVCYKELKVMIFDPTLAHRVGLRPALMQYVWLTIVSLTTVVAFEVAGSVLIVALMIAPPASAFLLTQRLGRLLAISIGLAALCSVGGFYLGLWLDISPTGPIASVSGCVFLAVLVMAPKRGIISKWIRHIQQQRAIERCLVLEIASDSANLGEAIAAVKRAMRWSNEKSERSIAELVSQNLLVTDGEFQITANGIELIYRQTGIANRIG